MGRIAGIEVGFHWSWLLVFGLIIWSLADTIFPSSSPGLGSGTYLAMGVIGAVLFFTCLVLHELGHAVVAKREGMEIEGITLWVFGGVAKFKGMFPSARAEFRIAIAGPLVTLVLGGVLMLLSVTVSVSEAVDGVIFWLGYINLLLLVFNMLPALPLDGGRVLRSLIWRSTGDFTRSTRIAGGIGKAFGQVMIIGGVLMTVLWAAPGGLWLAFIGLFLVVAASAEASLATLKMHLGGHVVASAMATHPVTIAPDMPLREFADSVFAASRHGAYPVVLDGKAHGILFFGALAAMPEADWSKFRVQDRMTPLATALVLDPQEDLGDAAIKLAQDPGGRALVVHEGRLVGILSNTDISRLLELAKVRAAN